METITYELSVTLNNAVAASVLKSEITATFDDVFSVVFHDGDIIIQFTDAKSQAEQDEVTVFVENHEGLYPTIVNRHSRQHITNDIFTLAEHDTLINAQTMQDMFSEYAIETFSYELSGSSDLITALNAETSGEGTYKSFLEGEISPTGSGVLVIDYLTSVLI